MTDEDRESLIERLLEMEEGITLDFKEQYPLNSPSERKEFAKDLCAFANTNGGYIVIGIQDETWERVGIDSDDFDIDRMHQIASTLLTPHVPITMEIVLHEGCNYGIISIDKTHLVHYLQDNTVYIRDGSSNIRADPQTIVRLTLESAHWFQNQMHSPQDTSSFDLVKQLPNSIDDVFDYYIHNIVHDGILDRFSEGRREKQFLTKSIYRDFFKSFKGASNIEMDEDCPKTDDIGTRFLLLRGYGMIATAYLKRRDKNNLQKIRLVLEFDPAELTARTEESNTIELDEFFEWTKIFAGFNEQANDRELLELDLERQWDDILQFLRARFTYATEGMLRLRKLTKLYAEYYKKKHEILQNLKPLWWNILADLSVSSIPEIGLGKYID